MIEFLDKNVTSVDLLRISNLHKKNYPEGHLTKYFSIKFLSIYYSYFLKNGCFLIVERNFKGDVDGFVLAGDCLGELITKFKKQHRLLLIKESFFNINHFLKTLSKQFKYFFSPTLSFHEAKTLILSIVSDGNTKGVGSQVLLALIDELGVTNIGLYVKVSNVRAINFYLRHGFFIKNYISGQFYMERTVIS